MNAPRTNTNDRMKALRRTIEFFYDLQKLRIASGLRALDGSDTEELSDEDKQFLGKMSDGVKDLEKQALREVQTRLRGIPIYDQWLQHQKGCGPTMSGVILSTFDIHRAETVSRMWSYAGLSPNQKKVKGQKLNYNPWLKSKMVKVLAESFIKCNSPWRQFYDNYKHRLKHQLGTCMLCDGTGKYDVKKACRELDQEEVQVFEGVRNSATTEDIGSRMALPPIVIEAILQRLANSGIVRKRGDKYVVAISRDGTCSNCNGSGQGPWGRSDAHRDVAAKRYMIKMFLLELHKQWRTLEGLSVRPPYAEQYLGRVHHT